MRATFDTVATLNDLIEICKDNEFGFNMNAEFVAGDALMELFTNRAEECRKSAAELFALLVGREGRDAEATSVLGSAHRGWVIDKTTNEGHDNQSLLVECERGEVLAMLGYRKALDQSIPTKVRNVLERQHEWTRRNLAVMREMRDAGAATA